jgi:hypothetical protein
MPRLKPITVRQLIARLKLLPPDAVCITSNDPEGNGYHIVYEEAGELPESDLPDILDLMDGFEAQDIRQKKVVIIN